eukprot:3383827-Pleurochrysis_carterae.AAC.2
MCIRDRSCTTRRGGEGSTHGGGRFCVRMCSRRRAKCSVEARLGVAVGEGRWSRCHIRELGGTNRRRDMRKTGGGQVVEVWRFNVLRQAFSHQLTHKRWSVAGGGAVSV